VFFTNVMLARSVAMRLIQVQCVSCGVNQNTSRSMVGKKIRCRVCEEFFLVKALPPSREKQRLVAILVFLVLLTLILSAFGAIVWDYWRTRPTAEQQAPALIHETPSAERPRPI